MSDKEVKSLDGGKIVIVKPIDMTTIVPLFCYVCEFPMKTADDSISFRKHGVCSRCDGRWTNHRDVSWKEGKLPDKSSEDWQEYITLRALLSRPLIILK